MSKKITKNVILNKQEKKESSNEKFKEDKIEKGVFGISTGISALITGSTALKTCSKVISSNPLLAITGVIIIIDAVVYMLINR